MCIRARHNNTLDPTSLVHESYLKLIGANGGARFEDRAHFFAYAASASGGVVVDYCLLYTSLCQSDPAGWWACW